MTLSTARGLLLIGWAITLLAVLLAYATAWFAPPVRPNFVDLLASLGAVVGLLSPHITLAIEYYLSSPRKTTARMDKTAAAVLSVMCVSFWSLLVTFVWYGVTFRLATEAHGTGLTSTTSLIVTFVGLLSFLVVRPTARLFLLNAKNAA